MRFGARKASIVINVGQEKAAGDASSRRSLSAWFHANNTMVSAIVSVLIAGMGFASAVAVTRMEIRSLLDTKQLDQSTEIDTSAMLLHDALHDARTDRAAYLASYFFKADEASAEYLRGQAAASTREVGDMVAKLIERSYANASSIRGPFFVAIRDAEEVVEQWGDLSKALANTDGLSDTLKAKKLGSARILEEISFNQAFCSLTRTQQAYKAVSSFAAQSSSWMTTFATGTCDCFEENELLVDMDAYHMFMLPERAGDLTSLQDKFNTLLADCALRSAF